jgi:hypothetical protein
MIRAVDPGSLPVIVPASGKGSTPVPPGFPSGFARSYFRAAFSQSFLISRIHLPACLLAWSTR